jgi:hypothetical protein
MANNPSNQVTTESLNEVVIRLLGINDGDELSYQTYFERIKKKLFISRAGGKELPREEDELLRSELKRVRKIKDQGLRFKVKKVKVNTQSASVPPSSTPSQQTQDTNKNSSSAIVKRKDAIVKSKGGQLIPYEDLKPKEETKEQKGFTNIKRTLDSILSILASKFKFEQKEADTQRKDEEEKKREKRESLLEGFKKGFGKVVSLTKKMLSPFDAIIERIKRFLFFTLLGRGFNMFMRWMENKENREKFDSLVEFFTDHWPAIAGLYILFGTSFGKLVRGILKAAVRMIVALAMNIKKIRGFAKKYKGLIGLGIGVAAFSSGRIAEALGENKETPETTAIADGDKDLQDARETLERTKDFNVPESGSTPSTSKPQTPDAKAPALNLGGMIPKLEMPKFNLGGLIPQFAMGGINPFGGFDFQQGVPITGAGQDDTLIAAKTGEAVLTEKDQQDLSSRYVDRETGRPLNIPQYLSGRKSSFVNLNNVKIAGGYYKGGVIGGPTVKISKFNSGGVVGGSSYNLNSDINFNENTGFIPSFSTSNFNLGGNSPLLAQGGGLRGALSSGVSSLWNRFTGRDLRQMTPGQIGPQLTPEVKTGLIRRQPQSLARSARSMIDTNWSSSSVGINPTVGCAAAIKEVYRRSGINLPWPKTVNPNYVPDIHSYLSSNFLRVTEKGRKPGDIVIWEDDKKPPYGHIGIVMPDGRIANNSSSSGTFTNLNTPDEARGWWPNTRRLIYFRDPKIHRASTEQPNINQKDKGSGINVFGSLLRNLIPKKKEGGLIKENTGMDIPGATADRQLTALQPGEYVLPKETVREFGIPAIEKLVALTDSNSEAYLKRGKVDGPRITPYRNFNSGGVINLPPITAGSGMNRARASGLAGGSEVPSFSATAPHNERAKNASIYGLVG